MNGPRLMREAVPAAADSRPCGVARELDRPWLLLLVIGPKVVGVVARENEGSRERAYDFAFGVSRASSSSSASWSVDLVLRKTSC